MDHQTDLVELLILIRDLNENSFILRRYDLSMLEVKACRSGFRGAAVLWSSWHLPTGISFLAGWNCCFFRCKPVRIQAEWVEREVVEDQLW